MSWRDRIIVDPKILLGKPIITGTRISMEFVVDLLGRGWTVDQILHEYDHLAAEACLADVTNQPTTPSPCTKQR